MPLTAIQIVKEEIARAREVRLQAAVAEDVLDILPEPDHLGFYVRDMLRTLGKDIIERIERECENG